MTMFDVIATLVILAEYIGFGIAVALRVRAPNALAFLFVVLLWLPLGPLLPRVLDVE